MCDFEVPRIRVPACRQVRSTLLQSSVQSLRARGHLDAFLRHLPTAHHDTILYTPAGVWLSLEVAMAHYLACDALALPDHEIFAIGASVADVAQATLLSVVFRAARAAGASPWHALERMPRMWTRYYVGSGIAVYRVGPKDAEVAVVGHPLATVLYWRVGLRGILSALAGVLARTVRVRTRYDTNSADNLVTYQLSWV